MEVICLETDAFYELVEEVVQRISEKSKAAQLDKWISGEEAMKMLRISSPTTLAKMRNEGKIRYSQPSKKIILYDRDSINSYLDKISNEPF